jgi:hypothetical protein
MMRILVAPLMCSLVCAPAFGINQEEVIKGARNAYYVLRAQGLKDFHCTVVPNSKTFAESLKIGPDNPNVKLVNDLRLSVSVDEYSRWTITPFLTSGREIDHSFDQIVGGLSFNQIVGVFRQIIDGFYKLWGNLVLTNPIVGMAPSTRVREEKEGYRVSATANGMNVEVLLNKDYAMTEMNITSGDSKNTVWPTFTKTDKGFLLTSMKSSLNDGQEQISFDIDYRDIEGLKLPSKVVVSQPISGGQPITIELTFSKYQIEKMP